MTRAPTPLHPAPKTWRSAADRARALGGKTVRLATKFETLNKATRGGPAIGKLLIFGSAPGTGKTTLTTQQGHEWARAGIHVAIIAADEDADGLLIRIGQQIGLKREDLEEGNDAARAALAEHLDRLPQLMLIDLDEEETTVEEVSAELHRRANGAPSVLIVDSVQTARVIGIDSADGPRARVGMVMDTLKRAAKNHRHLVIATCELARGAYRSQNAAERIDDLASFKESGAIEYGASMALVLRNVAAEEGSVDVAVAKNRLGQRLSFRLSLNYVSASFQEVAKPTEADEVAKPSAMEVIKAKVLDCVRKTIQPINSGSDIARRIRKSKAPTLKAIAELVDDGHLVYDAKGNFSIGSAGSGTGSGTARGETVPAVPAPIGEPRTGTASWNRSGDDDA